MKQAVSKEYTHKRVNNMFKTVCSAIIVVMGVSFGVFASEGQDAINQVLQRLIPDEKPDRIVESPIPGMYEVSYGLEIFYVTGDGRYILRGDLLNTGTRQNLTEASRDTITLGLMNQIDPKSMIIFSPKEIKHTVTVFTDVDCAFCRKLHSQIADYNKYGIAVRYLAFPRTGVDTESYYKAVSVWCSDDRQAALTRAKLGETPKRKTCTNPVREHMALGDKLGVSGTPTIILEDGSLVSGYIPPTQMSQMLDKLSSAK